MNKKDKEEKIKKQMKKLEELYVKKQFAKEQKEDYIEKSKKRDIKKEYISSLYTQAQGKIQKKYEKVLLKASLNEEEAKALSVLKVQNVGLKFAKAGAAVLKGLGIVGALLAPVALGTGLGMIVGMIIAKGATVAGLACGGILGGVVGGMSDVIIFTVTEALEELNNRLNVPFVIADDKDTANYFNRQSITNLVEVQTKERLQNAVAKAKAKIEEKEKEQKAKVKEEKRQARLKKAQEKEIASIENEKAQDKQEAIKERTKDKLRKAVEKNQQEQEGQLVLQAEPELV